MPNHLRKLRIEELEREKLISQVAKNESETLKNIRMALFFGTAKNLVVPCYILLTAILLLPSFVKFINS